MFREASGEGCEHPHEPPQYLGRTKASMIRPSTPHLPVLPEDCLRLLDPRPGHFYLDGTVGAGGHARLLLEAAPGSVLVGFDRDPSALDSAAAVLGEFGPRAVLIRDDFKNWRRHDLPPLPLGGCLLDLGLSSLQIESSGRGFSFLRDEPLDMRMDPSAPVTAADLLNGSSAEDLQRMFSDYGEVPFARRLAAEIVVRRRRTPFARTPELLDAISAVAPRRGRTHHPATLPFMALRIAVNGELEGLEAFLLDAAAELAPGGRLVVISFHSLEDRIVKHTFRRIAAPGSEYTVLTRKPVVAGSEERARNPRSRSAKLRALLRRLPTPCEEVSTKMSRRRGVER